MATWRTVREGRPWCFDVEARPGPWGGSDFTFRNMLSIAAGYSKDDIAYLAPGFTPGALEDLITPLRQRGVLVVGHNVTRYDLDLTNGMLMKWGLTPLGPQLASDTLRHLKKRGYAFSGSLGNMSKRFGVQHKGSMSEYDWEQVYAGDPEYLDKLRRYNMGDVVTTLALRAELLRRQVLKPPQTWEP